ncbi:MAG: radical SAM family heme chaperone HemW [Chloroflexi bacterium]|nr:radical SAM family heme chaperone HemW [Chloroflexota bacterium]
MSLYVHVPFCKSKCPYCDFNTFQGIEHLMEPYLGALTTEIGLWGQVLGGPAVNTIFFGGGTPSYLPDGYIDQILAAARSAFSLDEDAEITIEANPGDLVEETCRRLLAQGVNRLSIGVQSLDNNLLAVLGRRHDAGQAIEAYRSAQLGGFSNVNLDLMYGLPNQTEIQWQDTLDRMAALRPAHISLYCLTLEEGTPFHTWVKQGKLPDPDPDLAANMYDYAMELLGEAGYHHYEISNWSLPGRACQHNMAYWRNLPYLGVGPGAHSSLSGYRFWDVSSPGTYLSQVKEWADDDPQPVSALAEKTLCDIPPVGGYEVISNNTACAETMFLGLRLLDGMDLAEDSARVGADLASKFHQEIQDLVELGLLNQQGHTLRLTKPAYLIANQVFTRFVE